MSNKRKIKVKAPKEKKEVVDPVTLMIRDSLKSMGRSVNPGQEVLLVQVYKFFMISVIATIIDFLIFIILYKPIKLLPLIANPISYVVAVIYHLIMRYNLIIKYKEKKKEDIISFCIIALLGLLLSEGFIYLLIKISPILGKILACIITFVIKKIYQKKKSHKK